MSSSGGDKTRGRLIIAALGLIPVLWTALLSAPYLSSGLFGIVSGFSEAMRNPFAIRFVPDTMRTILMFVVLYAFGIGIWLSSVRNMRPREEHGSASWGNAHTLGAKYAARKSEQNIILSQNVRIGLDGFKHKRNLNVLVVGGSGAGKTRYFALPNIMQCNTSFIVLDPKGELLRTTGYLLKEKGYDVRILDLIHMDWSDGYNPFVYIRNDADVMKLVTNLIKNTTPKGSNTNDPFWERAETALLQALIYYLWHYAPEDEQNFGMVMEMLQSAKVREDDEDYMSPLDILFERKEMEDPDCIAVKQYSAFKNGAGKTTKSILVSLAVRLEKFNLTSLAEIVSKDDLDMASIGDKKTAVFALIPDNDSSFNFIIGMLYIQLFQQLYEVADYKYHGRLPIPVHFLMDEFANVALPDEFEKTLSTCRSRSISCSIIIQNIAQLKALFDKQWESIIGNCDEFVYLGGNEQATHEYVSKLLGKETIVADSHGKVHGPRGNFSTNQRQEGRELLTPDEVRLLDNAQEILFIRGEKAVKDLKYDILWHPNVRLTAAGGADPYLHGIHGTMPETTAEIAFNPDREYEIFTSEEL